LHRDEQVGGFTGRCKNRAFIVDFEGIDIVAIRMASIPDMERTVLQWGFCVESIRSRYGEIIKRMLKVPRGNHSVTEKNVFQPGNPENLPYIDSIIRDHLLQGSGLRGFENLRSLHEATSRGEACLLLVEHYSNFDLPVIHYMIRNKGQEGAAIADTIIAIAGIKLSETNPAVLAFTETYSRIVIYPSRSIEIIKRNLKDPKELVAEMMRSSTVNRAAMKAMSEVKKSGKLILVFPAGTRYRPWDPESKKGVREIDSYIKSFDKMCFVSINGNILRLNPSGGMEDDTLHSDRMIVRFGPVLDCEAYREKVKHEHRFRDDKKQAVVDQIMGDLDAMHEETEKTRLDSPV
jgi:glycerol-3-phosphate O-acyltransferase